MTPEIHYAKAGDVSIAYCILGDGPVDLIIAPGWVSHAEVMFENPQLVRGFERLASFSRLILYDKREQGLSDRVGRPPTLEEMADDLRAVLDAAGSRQAAVMGISEGGAAAILFAAGHPERCSHLVLWGTYARLTRAPDYPEGVPPETLDFFADVIRNEWGGPAALEMFAPSLVGDAEAESWWAHLLRAGTSPGSAAALMDLYRELDARHALPAISAPTLVMHRSEDVAIPKALGRYLADNIPGARYVEFPGRDHLMWSESGDEIFDEVEEFLTGARHVHAPDRILATVMFTDIVDSTQHAASLGDGPWRELLDRHDRLVRDGVERHRGHVIKTTGDGVLATFDGPARAIGCAEGIVEDVRALGIQVRAGLHCGECERRGDDIGGMAVHIGSRVAGRAGPGEVLASGTVKDLVAGSGIEFEDRGSTELKGVPGEWRLFAVRS